MDSWTDEDMNRLLADILPLMSAAERRMVDQTNAYVAATAAAVAGAAFRPRTPRYADLTGDALRGVAADVVFRRPQMVLNYRLSRGDTVTQAVAAGEERLRSLGATNLQLAKTKTAAAQGTAPFYRRVLTGAENCALCVIASTQQYRRGDLMPIHPGCDCGVEEFVITQPARLGQPALIAETRRQIATRSGDPTRDVDGPISDFTDLITVRQHGELGPTLSWRADKFRGPAEAAQLAA